jgi:hypothetical protein
MNLRALLTITTAALLAASLFCARADDAKPDSTKKPSSGKTSAPAAGSASAKKDGSKKAGTTKPVISITPEREAAVLTFVQRNHAELADLLAVLKINQPEEYDRAVRDIFRTLERINQIQDRDPLQYELEVAAWTDQSRVQLLAARLKMGSTEELVKKLRDALATQNEAKLALLKHERQKASDRLAKIDSDISRYQTDHDEVIDKQLRILTRTSGEVRPGKLPPKTSPKTKANNSPQK